MEFSLLPLLVFALGLSLPALVLLHAAIDTARWQKQKDSEQMEASKPPEYYS